jgi:hypothetical protein
MSVPFAATAYGSGAVKSMPRWEGKTFDTACGVSASPYAIIRSSISIVACCIYKCKDGLPIFQGFSFYQKCIFDVPTKDAFGTFIMW